MAVVANCDTAESIVKRFQQLNNQTVTKYADFGVIHGAIIDGTFLPNAYAVRGQLYSTLNWETLFVCRCHDDAIAVLKAVCFVAGKRFAMDESGYYVRIDK